MSEGLGFGAYKKREGVVNKRRMKWGECDLIGVRDRMKETAPANLLYMKLVVAAFIIAVVY